MRLLPLPAKATPNASSSALSVQSPLITGHKRPLGKRRISADQALDAILRMQYCACKCVRMPCMQMQRMREQGPRRPFGGCLSTSGLSTGDNVRTHILTRTVADSPSRTPCMRCTVRWEPCARYGGSSAKHCRVRRELHWCLHRAAWYHLERTCTRRFSARSSTSLFTPCARIPSDRMRYHQITAVPTHTHAHAHAYARARAHAQ